MILNKHIFKSNNHEITMIFKDHFKKKTFSRISQNYFWQAQEKFQVIYIKFENIHDRDNLFEITWINVKFWDIMNQSHEIDSFKNKRCVIFKISRISDDFKQTYFNIMIMNKDEFQDVSLIQANLKINEIITTDK